MADTTQDEAEHGELDDHAVPADLLELYEVLEYERLTTGAGQ